MGHGAWGIGHWAWGIGHGALGIGPRRAWGMGHWAWAKQAKQARAGHTSPRLRTAIFIFKTSDL